MPLNPFHNLLNAMKRTLTILLLLPLILLAACSGGPTAPQNYTLTVGVRPGVEGAPSPFLQSATIAPCAPSDTLRVREDGQQFTLSAGACVTLMADFIYAVDYWTFVGWGGDIQSNERIVTFPVNSNMTVWAVFAKADTVWIDYTIAKDTVTFGEQQTVHVEAGVIMRDGSTPVPSWIFLATRGGNFQEYNVSEVTWTFEVLSAPGYQPADFTVKYEFWTTSRSDSFFVAPTEDNPYCGDHPAGDPYC